MYKWLVLVLLYACGTSEPESKPLRKPDVWQSLSAADCVKLCEPLPVARFTPHCSRRNSKEYWCGSVQMAHEDVCSCGGTGAQSASTTVVESPNLVAPVLLHHGLKAVLKH